MVLCIETFINSFDEKCKFSGMVSILNSFEERLSKLEATILPVYQETDNLRRRQENIDKTLEALDHVIGFYNVSKGKNHQLTSA